MKENKSSGYIQKIVTLSALPAEYYIVFVWNDEGDTMCDVRSFDKVEQWGSGPLSDVRIFRNEKIEEKMGVGSGNTYIVLGREEEHRRNCKGLKSFFESRPQIPNNIVDGE